ncbi:unnamed protein product [Camellia sinensis]
MAAGVDNTFRRKFDREEYLERAREREQKTKGPPIQRKPLKHRDYEVDLDSRLGKTQVVTPIAPLSQQAGYYCSVCECVVKDSANYLDHINGKKHQRALGMSMRVERASLEQIYIQQPPVQPLNNPRLPLFAPHSSARMTARRKLLPCIVFGDAGLLGEGGAVWEWRGSVGEWFGKKRRLILCNTVQERFELLKKRKDTGPFTEQDFDDRILKQQQEEEERKRQRRERKKEKKKEKAAEEETEVDADVAAMMGFGGFGSSKKYKAGIMVGGEGVNRNLSKLRLEASMSRKVERKILHLRHGHKTRTQIHAHFLRQSNQILSHFISVCFSFHRISYAKLIFHQTYDPNIFLFNSMIKGHSLSKPFQNSLQFFTIMKSRGIWPNEFTFAPLLKSCSILLDLKMGQGVHKEVISAGFESFSSIRIRIGIVELYESCGTMEDAMKVFDEMPHRDVIVWNLMIRGFCEIGDFEMGFRLFRQMSERNVVSWNVMISSLARSRQKNEALEIFCQMQDNGFKPDEATVVSVLPVCARLEAVDIGQWILSYAKSKTTFTIFKDMPRKNVVSWNAMISGLAFNGKGELGVDLFEEMLLKDVKPNDVTFVVVLACCAHVGLVQQGLDLFASMTTKHQIELKLEHYGLMVDLLGRSGCVKEVHDLICTMPMNLNATLWGALLSACHTHDNMELAESAVKELIDLEPWNFGNYVLLSNVYAERGKWDEVEKERVLMTENRINKALGQSMVG